MAKKKKAVAKKKAPAKKAVKAIKKALAKPLRQPTLGGISRVRNARLDKLAESIGDCRDQINQATTDEKSFRAAALKEMQDKGIEFWSHAGVDFIRVPGEDKLKVKTHKDGGSAETGGEGPGEDTGGSAEPGDVDPDEIPF